MNEFSLRKGVSESKKISNIDRTTNWNKVLWAGQDNELAMAMRKQQKKSIEDSK